MEEIIEYFERVCNISYDEAAKVTHYFWPFLLEVVENSEAAATYRARLNDLWDQELYARDKALDLLSEGRFQRAVVWYERYKKAHELRLDALYPMSE
ncbi:MAG: hypothetical protein EBR30_22175 [Cytophagia bacterium]|nr:hypothetical protein [Cytophagia bacterium]NBW37674.1 hypothetical protein [Cytophagia bacterium]